MRKPILLSADNFTPPARTPWGGTRIVGKYKAGLVEADAAVGESWEISVEPDFPARVAETGELLSEVLSADPDGWLGAEAARGHAGTALLVKLLDAADALSVQIHPSDGYRALAADQAGKPESWYIVERDEGAVLYLGLRDGVSREQMARALEREEDVSALLARVPVEPGDFFRIDAGTAHAIGPGITLVEPQYVTPGRRGVTYRYWDFHRRYDSEGRLDPAGAPRPLHVRDALEVTRWDAPREEALLARIRLRAGTPHCEGPVRIDPLCGPGGGLPSEHLWVERWSGTGSIAPAARDRLLGVTVLAGELELTTAGGSLVVPSGRSAVVPARVGGLGVALDRAHALACSVA